VKESVCGVLPLVFGFLAWRVWFVYFSGLEFWGCEEGEGGVGVKRGSLVCCHFDDVVDGSWGLGGRQAIM